MGGTKELQGYSVMHGGTNAEMQRHSVMHRGTLVMSQIQNKDWYCICQIYCVCRGEVQYMPEGDVVQDTLYATGDVLHGKGTVHVKDTGLGTDIDRDKGVRYMPLVRTMPQGYSVHATYANHVTLI